jgi:hypothetical protein
LRACARGAVLRGARRPTFARVVATDPCRGLRCRLRGWSRPISAGAQAPFARVASIGQEAADSAHNLAAGCVGGKQRPRTSAWVAVIRGGSKRLGCALTAIARRLAQVAATDPMPPPQARFARSASICHEGPVIGAKLAGRCQGGKR